MEPIFEHTTEKRLIAENPFALFNQEKKIIEEEKIVVKQENNSGQQENPQPTRVTRG